MQARTWLLTTLGTALLVVGVVQALNAAVDIYGLYRNPAGRRLPVYGDERIAKYLLCDRYVPANFDALLVGSSVTANWNTGAIDALGVYNASVNGGNIVEERCLVESALTRPGIRVALLVVHPYLTRSHEFMTVPLTPREKVGALGSVNLLMAYKSKLKMDYLGERQASDGFGTNDFVAPAGLNSILQRLMRPGESFEVDPIAMDAYRETIAMLRSRNVRLVFIVPPFEEQLLRPKQEAVREYVQLFRRQMTPQDKMIDFTSDEYAGFRQNRQNFSDGIHAGREGAKELVSLINAQLKAWM